MRRLKRKNIKRFRQFKPQAFQTSSFKADPDFRQDDSYGDNSARQADSSK